MIELLRQIKRGIPQYSFWGLKKFARIILLRWKSKKEKGDNLWNINEELHSIMIEYIDKNLSDYRLPMYEECAAQKKGVDDQCIWVCWLQGKENMPEIVRACYQSLLRNSNGHKVILITWENIEDYINIPQNIKRKVGKGMPYANFSDYIRLNLLSLYGGLWIDATFLVTEPLDETIFHTKFFSIKNNVHENWYVGRFLWAVNFVYASADCEYIKHIRNLFCAFWERNEKSINYLFVDYCFEYERLTNHEFDNALKEMPFSNEHQLSIILNFNNEYNQALWDEWLSDTSLFKLTYKGKMMTKTKEGKLTVLGYLLEKYS